MKTTFKTTFVEWSLNNDCDGGADYVLIELVSTPPADRGQGQARRCLELALAEIRAAHPGKAIRLVVEPKDDETSFDGLVDFYESVGFEGVATYGGPAIMEY